MIEKIKSTLTNLEIIKKINEIIDGKLNVDAVSAGETANKINIDTGNETKTITVDNVGNSEVSKATYVQDLNIRKGNTIGELKAAILALATKYSSSSNMSSITCFFAGSETWTNNFTNDSFVINDGTTWTIKIFGITGTDKLYFHCLASTYSGKSLYSLVYANNWGTVNKVSFSSDLPKTVTTTVNGLMLATDKVKLDSIASGANNYTLPTASDSILGGVKIGDNININDGIISVPAATGSVRGTVILSDAANSSSSAYAATTAAVNKVYTIANNKAELHHNHNDVQVSWDTSTGIAGGVSPIDMATSSCHSANRLAFAKAAGIVIEYSRDGGSTWIDYETSDAEKRKLVSGIGSKFYIGAHTSEVSLNDKLRITLNASNMGVYTLARKMLININTSGASDCTVLVEKSMKGAETVFDTINTYNIAGFSGWNSIPLGFPFGGSDNQTGNTAVVRLTFSIGTLHPSSSYTSALTILDILIFGNTYWATPSDMAKTNHLYAYDIDKNAVFPGTVTASSFIGNAATATKLETARTINGVTFDGTKNITVADSTKLPITGGTMTGALTLKGDPTTDLMAATKKYVDDSTANLLSSNNVWTGSNIFNKNITVSSGTTAGSDGSIALGVKPASKNIGANISAYGNGNLVLSASENSIVGLQSGSVMQWSVVSDETNTKTSAYLHSNLAATYTPGTGVVWEGVANSADKLTVSAGTATQPIFFNDGVPQTCTYSLNKTVPANAVFTDTTYSVMKGATTTAAGSTGLVPVAAAGSATRYLRSDGTWVVPPDTNTTYTAGASISISGTTIANTGVRTVTAGSSANQISVNTGGTTTTITINNVANATNATKATQDKNGKDITTTYLPVAGGTVTGSVTATKFITSTGIEIY